KISADRQTLTTFIGAEQAQPAGKTGMFVDEANGDFWVCTIATDFSVPSELRRYDLGDGSLQQTIALTNGGICNDIATDDDGNLYITDSFVGVQRLPAGSSTLEAWSTDALL